MNVAMKVRNSYRDQARPFDGPGFFYSRGIILAGMEQKRMHRFVRFRRKPYLRNAWNPGRPSYEKAEEFSFILPIPKQGKRKGEYL